MNYKALLDNQVEERHTIEHGSPVQKSEADPREVINFK